MESRILKQPPARNPRSVPSTQRVVKRRVVVALDDADRVLDSARDEAAQIINEAEGTRDQIQAAAREEGYQAGLAQWTAAIVDAENSADRYFRSAEEQLVRLAVGIARKIVAEQVRLSPETVVSITRQAISKLRQGRELTVQVHPEAVPMLEQRIAELQNVAGQGCRIHIAASHAIEPGGCVIISEFGTVDARLETQLKVLERLLLKEPPQ